MEPYAHSALALSDNTAAGQLIDLAGGIAAVNTWAGAAGLGGTRLAHWYGRASPTAPRQNLTTARDLACFYYQLRQGGLLGPPETSALTAWLSETPRRLSGYDGALTDRLPQAVADGAIHKTGWLPPPDAAASTTACSSTPGS